MAVPEQSVCVALPMSKHSDTDAEVVCGTVPEVVDERLDQEVLLWCDVMLGGNEVDEVAVRLKITDPLDETLSVCVIVLTDVVVLLVVPTAVVVALMLEEIAVGATTTLEAISNVWVIVVSPTV